MILLVALPELCVKLLLCWQKIADCHHILVSIDQPAVKNKSRKRIPFGINNSSQNLYEQSISTCFPSNRALYGTVVFRPNSFANPFTNVRDLVIGKWDFCILISTVKLHQNQLKLSLLSRILFCLFKMW